jgi:phosphatidylinositol dimannoside acyltransferase
VGLFGGIHRRLAAHFEMWLNHWDELSLMPLLKDIVLWTFWNPFKQFIQRVHPSLVYPSGMLLSVLAFHVFRSKRKALEKEVDFIFGPTIDIRKRGAIVHGAFRNAVYNELEMLLFPVLNQTNIASFAVCQGLERLDAALSAGKGAVLLFAHFGANQMIMPAIGYRGYGMCQLSAPATVWKEILRDKRLSAMEERALEARSEHEMSLPVKHINIFRSVKEAFLCLRRNEVLGVAIDGGGGKERIAVDFLGRKVLLSPGPMDIARRTGCAVLPTFALREGSGRNMIVIEPPLDVTPNEDAKTAIARLIQVFAHRLEECVRLHPDHYINFMALRTAMAERGDISLFPRDER